MRSARRRRGRAPPSGCTVRGPKTQAHQVERQILRRQGIDGPLFEAMTKHRGHCLGAMVDTHLLATKPGRFAAVQQGLGNEFPQGRFRERERQARIASRHRMTDLITLVRVEQQDMVRIGDALIVPDVPQVDAAIGEYQMRDGDAFLHAAMAARPAAPDIAQRHGLRIQESCHQVFGSGGHFRRLYPEGHSPECAVTRRALPL